MAAADKTLIVIVGPTGSGKTELAVSLAERFAAPVISTDSRQIYRDLPIGTAQPDAAQLQRAEHHFIATHAIDEEFNCGAYEQAALALLDKLFTQHPTVIAVGGSGLYVKALCDGLDDLPEAAPEIRKELAQRLRDEGLEPLAEQLRQLDPEYYRQVDTKNPARVLRALEVCLSTGQPYSSLRIGEPHERPFRIVMIGTQMERAELYRRIDRRVDEMMAGGARRLPVSAPQLAANGRIQGAVRLLRRQDHPRGGRGTHQTQHTPLCQAPDDMVPPRQAYRMVRADA